MDYNKENFSGFEEEATENRQSDNSEEQSKKSEEFDEILSELNNRSKKLETCITARQTCNKLKDRIRDCKERLEAQDHIVEGLKSHYASIIAIEVTNDDEYKNSAKQDCLSISEYARIMSQEIDSNPDNISKSVDKIKVKLTTIEAKSKIVSALQEKNKIFPICADLQKQWTIAENRFQVAYADYNDNRSF